MNKASALAATLLLFCASHAGARGAASAHPVKQASDDEVLMRLHLTPGQEFHTVYTSDDEATTIVLGRNVQVVDTSLVSMDHKVLQVSAGGLATLQSTITAMTINNSVDGVPTGYSSVSPNSNASALGTLISTLVGVPLTVTYAANGTVRKASGFNALWSRIPTRTNGAENATLTRAKSLLKGKYVDSKPQNLGEESILLPPHALRVGDSWITTLPASGAGMEASIKAIYTFQGREQGVDLVSLKVANTKHKATILVPTGTITSTLSFSGEGKREIDQSTGWTARGDTSISCSGTMTIPFINGDGMTFPVPMTMTMREHIVTTNLPGLDEVVSISAGEPMRVVDSNGEVVAN